MWVKEHRCIQNVWNYAGQAVWKQESQCESAPACHSLQWNFPYSWHKTELSRKNQNCFFVQPVLRLCILPLIFQSLSAQITCVWSGGTCCDAEHGERGRRFPLKYTVFKFVCFKRSHDLYCLTLFLWCQLEVNHRLLGEGLPCCLYLTHHRFLQLSVLD